LRPALRVEGKTGASSTPSWCSERASSWWALPAGKSERPVPLPCKSPRALGGANTQSLCVYVDEVDAHCKTARAAGAKIVEEPTTHDYGEEYWADRSYRAEDLEGHQWWFMQRVRDLRTSAR